MELKNLQSILAMVIGFGLGVLWESCTHECPELIDQPTEITTTVDSTLKIALALPIVVEAERPRVARRPGIVTVVDTVVLNGETRYDTVLQSEPFTFSIDTVLARGDTVSAWATFPPPELNVVVRPAPDTLVERRSVIVVDRPVPQKKPWYEEPAKAGLYIGGGFIAGYLFRLATDDCTQIINQLPASKPALLNVQLRF